MSGRPRLLWARWSRPLHGAPAVGAAGPSAIREGVLVALGRDGRWGVGDAAPLPGLSAETLTDVTDTLTQGAGALLGPDGPRDTHAPALASALDAAWMDLEAPPGEAPALTTSHLWTDEALEAPPPSLAGRILKLKVGRRPLAEECANVSRLSAAGVRLRLDGNRRLGLDAARALTAAAGDRLDFFEEPGPGVSSAALGARTALDESIDDACRILSHGDGDDDAALGRRLRALGDASVWVVKPTVVGPRRSRQLARLAADARVTVVLSSAYDSSVGRRGLVRLGAGLGLDAVAHGLGTGALLAPDLVARPGPVLVEAGDLVRVGGALSPASFEGLSWQEVSP